MEDTVRLIANAGVLIRFSGMGILVDALHTQPTKKFSTLDYALLRKIVTGREGFSDIGLMLVTHDHIDHNDNAVLLQFIERHQETVVLTPSLSGGEKIQRLGQKRQSFQASNIHVEAARLTHTGEKYKEVENYGFLLEAGGKTLLFLGDSMDDAEGIRQLIGGRHIDAAFLNFPLVTLARGKRIVREVIRPDKVFVFHLPFVQDDREGYLKATMRSVEREKDFPPCTLLYEENQVEELWMNVD